MTRILHCPSLGRDVSAIQARVPDAIIAIGPRLADGYAGCTAGHQAIVREAQDAHADGVWVIEDDCAFTEAFDRAAWDAAVVWARDHGYTMVVGGSVSMKAPVRVRAGLFAVQGFKSTHCIVYLPDAYDVVRRVGPGPIDKQLAWLGGKPVVVHPFVAVQAPAFSGALNRLVDYRPEYAAAEHRLTEVAS